MTDIPSRRRTFLRFPLPSFVALSYHRRVSRLLVRLVAWAIPLGFLGASSLSLADPAPAAQVQRAVINRIVAIVDQEVITLVELRRRAEPFQKRLTEVPPDKRAAAEAQLHRDLIQEAIDERLIAREARALRISIDSEDINRTIDYIAKSKSVTREKLLQLVVEQGFSEAQYREQLVKQLLVAKLMRIKMAEQLKNVDKDPEKSAKQMEKLEKAYLQSLRANVFLEVRL